MKKLLGPIGGLLAIIGVVFVAYFHFVDTFATGADVKKDKAELKEEIRAVEKKADTALQSIQIEAIDRRIWVIKERHGERPNNKTAREELEKLEKNKSLLEKKLEEKK